MSSIKVATSIRQVLRQHARQTLSAGVKVCLLLGLAAAGYAQNSVAVASDDNPVVPLAQQTDQQIGLLLQRWPELDAMQRRDLLAEVRKRMHLAKKAEATANSANLQNRISSLTLRIKRAQIQHSYGRVSNRRSGSLNDQQVRQPQNQPANRDAPANMVIRTTVTRILPDGTRLVRKQTLLPGYRSNERSPASAPASGNAQQVTTNPVSDSAQSMPMPMPMPMPMSMPMPGKVRVIRTTVRFGAGFDQRSRRATSEEHPTDATDGVRRVSTPPRATPEQRTEGIKQ